MFITTKTVLRDEVAMLQFARDGQRKRKPLLISSSSYEEGKVNTQIARAMKSLGGLSDEQKKAALHILNSRDTVTGIVGKAGTGKTTMMRATRDAMEGEGHRVLRLRLRLRPPEEFLRKKASKTPQRSQCS